MYTTVHIDQHLKKVLLLLFNHKVLLKYEFINEVFQDGTCVFGMPSAAPFLCMDVSLVFEMRRTFDLRPTISTGYSCLLYGQF